MNRIRVLDRLPVDFCKMHTSIDKSIEFLKNVKEEYENKGWSSIHLKEEGGYDYVETVFFGMRDETDSEFYERKVNLQKEEDKKQRKVERDLKKLQQLKEQYGV